jgi:chromosome segregation ATPase
MEGNDNDLNIFEWQTEEAQKQIIMLQKEHSNQISELAGRAHESQEEISLLREAPSKLSQERAALIQEKKELEASRSKMISELAASSCNIANAEIMALADKSMASTHLIWSYSKLKIWR